MPERGRTGRGIAVTIALVALIATGVLYALHLTEDEQHQMLEVFRSAGDDTADQIYFGNGRHAVFGRSGLVGLFAKSGGIGLGPGETGPLPALVTPPDRVVVSRGGHALGRVESGDQPGGLPLEFALIDQGAVKWSTTIPKHGTFYVSDDASTVVAVESEYHDGDPPRVSFFDAQGGLVRTIIVPGLRRAYVSGNGSRVALRTNGSVTVHDASGLVQFAAPVSGACFFSDDGRTLVVLQRDAAVVYRAGHEVARAVTAEPPISAALTPDGNLVAVVDKTHLYVLDVQTDTLSAPRVTLGDERFRSVAISRQGGRVLAGSLLIRRRATEHQEGRARATVWSFDAAGQELRPEQRFVTTLWGQVGPEVQFIDDEGKASVVRTRDRVLLLDLK